MKARPILFSGPMVRALLEGRKTQTRRVVKPHQPGKLHLSGEVIFQHVAGANWAFLDDDGVKDVRCPYGDTGDLLWVRETFTEAHPCQIDEDRYNQAGNAGIPGPPPVSYRVVYRADGEIPKLHFGAREFPWRDRCPDGCTKEHAWEEQHSNQWTPSILMPRDFSRLTLRVVAIRIERLQIISESDAQAEGTDKCELGSHICAFSSLWDSINGQRAWEANPWVWVVSFDVLQSNIDAYLNPI